MGLSIKLVDLIESAVYQDTVYTYNHVFENEGDEFVTIEDNKPREKDLGKTFDAELRGYGNSFKKVSSQPDQILSWDDEFRNTITATINSIEDNKIVLEFRGTLIPIRNVSKSVPDDLEVGNTVKTKLKLQIDKLKVET